MTETNARRLDERKYLEQLRVALLAEVDAIEEYLGMIKTSDIRRWAKDKGYYGIIRESDK